MSGLQTGDWTQTGAVQKPDVVIVGGGIVGGLAALLLAEAGVTVMLLDQAMPQSRPASQDITGSRPREPRVWALSPASISLLQRVGVWAQVDVVAPYYAMQVWQRNGAGELILGQIPARDAQLQQPSLEPLGYMVEPVALTGPLQQALAERVNYLAPASLQHMDWLGAQHGWRLQIRSGQQTLIVETPLLIGADGAQSWVRQQAGIALDELDYAQGAISAAIRTEQPHGGVARQIYHQGYPLALLPMADLPADTEPGHWVSVVWSLPAGEASFWMNQTADQLAEGLTLASEQVLGRVQQVEARSVFPLKARQARQYVMPNLALIGDAAHTIHPMAGQGANLGCLDAAVLVDTLLHDRSRGVWAALSTLQKYERYRRLPDALMMHGMSLLGVAFDLGFKPLQVMRSETIQQLDQLPLIKQRMVDQASGWPDLQRTRYALKR